MPVVTTCQYWTYGIAGACQLSPKVARGSARDECPQATSVAGNRSRVPSAATPRPSLAGLNGLASVTSSLRLSLEPASPLLVRRLAIRLHHTSSERNARTHVASGSAEILKPVGGCGRLTSGDQKPTHKVGRANAINTRSAHRLEKSNCETRLQAAPY